MDNSNFNTRLKSQAFVMLFVDHSINSIVLQSSFKYSQSSNGDCLEVLVGLSYGLLGFFSLGIFLSETGKKKLHSE